MKRKIRICKILFPQVILTASMTFFALSSCDEISLFGETVNVQFDTQGGSFINTLKVKKNHTVVQPQDPQKEDAEFVGWYQDPLFVTPFDFSQPITQDTTVFALWNEFHSFYDLDFSTDGHGTLSSNTMTKISSGTQWSELVSDPLFPTITPIDNYEFKGWYMGDYKLENDSPAVITRPWSVIARFDPPTPVWTVTFIPGENGGLDDNEPATVIDGSTWAQLCLSHQLPTPHAHKGYAFDGWYKDNVKLNNDDQTKITCSFAVYAKFKLNPAEPYKITLLNPKEDSFVLSKKEIAPGKDLSLDVISLFEFKQNDINCLLCNGKPISNYTFTPSPKHNNRATIFIPESEINGDIVIGFMPPNAPKAINFETDDWSTLIYYINRGPGALMTAYHVSNMKDFIGAKKEIMLNNIKHYVRIIGINNDYLDQDHTQSTLFTFQFDNIISNRDGKALLINWNINDQVGNKDYWHSTLDNALNGTKVKWVNDDTGNNKSVIEMIENDNVALYAHIKDVDRSVNIYDINDPEDSHFVLIHKKTKIFCLNLANVFSKLGIENTSQDIIPGELKEMYINEANQFPYYKNMLEDHVIDDTGWPDLIKREAKKDDPRTMQYWFASPNLSDSDFISVYRINQFGKFGTSHVLNDYGVAPCFAI